LIIFDPQSEKTLKIVIVVIDSVDFIEWIDYELNDCDLRIVFSHNPIWPIHFES
jgi:hypothetical protein